MKRPLSPINTPAKVTQAREYLGLDKKALGTALRMGTSGRDSVRRWETPGISTPGPVQIALELMVREKAGE